MGLSMVMKGLVAACEYSKQMKRFKVCTADGVQLFFLLFVMRAKEDSKWSRRECLQSQL